MANTAQFTCPNKHTFTAIAKLRSRCPQCGVMSRRNFQAPALPDLKSDSPIKPQESAPKPPTTSPDSSHKVVNRKGSVSGSKPDSTSAKEKPSESGTKLSGESKPKPTAQIIKQGLPRTIMPKATNPTRKPLGSKATPPAPTRGPVKRVTAKSGIAPKVTKPPTGSRERKVVEATTEEPFWHQVKRKYFR